MMHIPIHTELTLSANLRTLPIVQAYVRELAGIAGFSPEESAALVLAMEEACTNSIEHAFDSGEIGSLTLLGELSSQALSLAILDSGLPFDHSVAPVYKSPKDVDTSPVSLRGLGLELIRRAVDEVRWISHGDQGKELRLTKYLPCRDSALAFGDEQPPKRSCEEPTKTSHPYIIRRMLPQDAVRVCQCFYRTFGYSYDEELYIPERLIHLNQTGEFISVVAVDEESGEVAGHVALVRPNLIPVGERTHLVVSPAHRSQQLGKRMGDFLERELQQVGLTGSFGQAVTNHTLSQQASEARGFQVCAILLGKDPAYHFKKSRFTQPGLGLPTEAGKDRPFQRETLVFYFKAMQFPSEMIVHAPPRHQEILTRIYERLQAPIEYRKAEPATGPGLVSVSYLRGEQLGEIQVKQIGWDTAAEIRRARRDLCDIGGAEVVFLDLPLAQAGTPGLCEAAEEDGFFFSGVRPQFAPDGDFLRLQYLNVELDPGKIQILSSPARELLQYILEERHRVGRSA